MLKRRDAGILYLLGIIVAIAADGPGLYINQVVGSWLAGIDPFSLAEDPAAADRLFNQILDFFIAFPERQNTIIFWLLMITAFLFIIWIFATIAQGALIDVGKDHDLPSIQILPHWRVGRQLLWRLVLIDAIVFFPLFALYFVILMFVNGGLFYMLQSLEATGQFEDFGIFAIIGLCVSPLICLSLPLFVLSIPFRIITFRAAVVENLTARKAIKAARISLQSHASSWVIVTLITLIIWGIFSGLTSINGVIWGSMGNILPGVGGLFLTLEATLTLMISAVKYVVISIFWTQAYVGIDGGVAIDG
ncbi:MAG: hypothetical protein AAF633_24415 [Chloroflexota bacterium]